MALLDPTRRSAEAGPGRDLLLFRELTEQIIGAAMEVHRHLGGGFLEKVYERALGLELQMRGIRPCCQQEIPVAYKGSPVGLYVADLLVEESVICEIKAVDRIVPLHEAQLLHYLKATGVRVGLLLNFGGRSLTFRRLIL